MSIIDVVSQARQLEGSKKFLAKAVSYVNTIYKNGNEFFTPQSWIKPEDFEAKFSFARSAFRTVSGFDHTMFVLDIDTYPEVRLHKLTTKVQLREIRILAVYKLIEEIIAKDSNFFTYTSGKGGYAVRRVEPAVNKLIFMKKIQELFEYCPHNKKYLDDDKDKPNPEYCDGWEQDDSPPKCGLWHEWTRKLFQWRKIDTELGAFDIQMAVDLNMITKAGRQVFRIPYSIYHKFAGHTFVCAPIVWLNEHTIDVEESLRQTDTDSIVIKDYEVPVEIMDIENEEGIIVDIKAMMNEKTRGLPAQFVRLDIPTPEEGLTVQQWAIVNKMEELLIGSPEKTPPCIRNSYIHKMPDEHHSRAVFGRYLLHKGYNPAQIGMFIRFKVNDHEDNAPNNLHQLDRNIHLYITPTPANSRKPSRCEKMQNRGNTFFCCRPEDAKVCGRRYVLESPTNTRAAKAKSRAIARKELIPQRVENGVYGRFDPTVKTVTDMLDDNDPILVKKTTRAGLTTSLIIGAAKKDKRLLVLEPTNRIGATTFRAAMQISREQYHINPTGAVLVNNPLGCLKLMIKGMQLQEKKNTEPEWGSDGVQWLKLPMVLKPSCGDIDRGETPCEFYDNVFPTVGDPVVESEVTSIEGSGNGRCARITVMRNLSKYDVVFATYAKMMATVASDTDTSLVAYSELSDYDIILLDEISTLVDGQPTIIDIAGIQQDGKTRLRTGNIREDFTRLISNRRSDYPVMEELMENALGALEEAIHNLRMNFIRGGKKTIIVTNPLSMEDRDEIISQYAAVQYAVEHTNLDLTLLATFLLTLTEEEWYLTAITNLYNYTHIKMVTKPEIILLRRFLSYMQRKGKKIIITDAALPPMSMESLLHIRNIRTVDLGDPRDTNALSLLIPDTKKVNVTDLILQSRRGEDKDPLNREKVEQLIHFITTIVHRHGEDDTMLILPNGRELYSSLKGSLSKIFGIASQPEKAGLYVTYYRSDVTVGVSSERRTMIVVCKPLPPEDSFDWLAMHYANDRNDLDNITGISNMFREHSARQSFYQTIGRAKDPSAATPSVIYCYGIKNTEVRGLLRDFDPPVILSKPSTDISLRLNVGSHWRRTGELLNTVIVAAINYVEKRGRVKSTDMQNILKREYFEYFMKNLSVFGIMYEKETGYLYLHKD